ncbi:MAG: GNAT family N-acetyltransferase [Hyphomonadaceae bacterium]|nr:GNAT family N-acetyltransferase [Hyphomonadaceae bacterium]
MIIRRAQAADAAALNAIVQGSESHKGVYAPMLDGYEITAEQIARDQIHVADEGGAVLGFYSLMLGDTPELDLLFVDDAAQGRGLGRQLMAHMAQVAAQNGVTAVKIVSHPPAADFYRGLGAIDVGYAYPMGRVTWVRPILTLPIGLASD